MPSRGFARLARVVTVVGATILLSGVARATVESSCAAPCKVPPKSALFVRESGGNLNAGGYGSIAGTLRKGMPKTVLRLEASATIDLTNPLPRFMLMPTVNGVGPGVLGFVVGLCSPNDVYCSATGTFWFDIDALEAAHPGAFIGKPLNIVLSGGPNQVSNGGQKYDMTFSAQIVNKR
jgi:hypothetical protein